MVPIERNDISHFKWLWQRYDISKFLKNFLPIFFPTAAFLNSSVDPPSQELTDCGLRCAHYRGSTVHVFHTINTIHCRLMMQSLQLTALLVWKAINIINQTELPDCRTFRFTKEAL